MKLKRGTGLLLIVILFSLLAIPILSAQDNESELDEIEQAYSCLKDKLGSDCDDTSSTEQAAFSLLAMAHDSSIQSDCESSLNNKEKSNCWGQTASANCDLKSTAQAVLALNNINTNVDDSINWLLNKKKIATNLDWFLEIDANEETSCEIKVDGGSKRTFTIDEDKKISGTTTCLSPAEGNYFLRISDSCLEDTFTISCDKNFITTLLYKKSGQDTLYVSSQTHSASAGDETEEKVNAYCFATSNTCDYEGSLWASLALAKAGESIFNYLPYLSSEYDEVDNKEYFPSAFLYMLTNDNDYYIDVTDKQQQGKYWQENSNWHHDTALALLSLQNLVLEEVDNAKDYLLDKQDSSGCWHSDNVKDTAFILYAWESKTPASTNGGASYCTSFGHYCVSAGECAESLDNFYCPSLSDVCCEVEPEQQSCSELNGFECESGQTCTGSEIIASDTNYCCLGNCVAVGENECEQANYFCKTECDSGEEQKFGYGCDYIGDICCAEKEGGWTLIILLVILIVLVVLAIVFRNQLKIWLFRIKSKFRFGKGPSGFGRRPPIPPLGGIPKLMRPRQIIPSRPARHYRKPATRRTNLKTPRRHEKDTLFDETMKKLKEMSE